MVQWMALVAGLAAAGAAMAGCAEGEGHTCPPDAGLQAPAWPAGNIDLIVPGQMCVAGPTDRSLAWVHNPTSQPVSGEWSLTLPGGEPLPARWIAYFEPRSATLAANGTKAGGTYPDWSRTLLSLTVPENGTGTHAAELRFGPYARQVRIDVAADRGRVSMPGDDVQVEYTGRFAGTGEEFDSGAFPTELGSRGTVPGFSFGLMGLARGETRTLVVPPAFAYGYDQPPGDRQQFSGEALAFTVRLTSIH